MENKKQIVWLFVLCIPVSRMIPSTAVAMTKFEERNKCIKLWIVHFVFVFFSFLFSLD